MRSPDAASSDCTCRPVAPSAIRIPISLFLGPPATGKSHLAAGYAKSYFGE